MSVLEKINNVMASVNVSVETGVFSDEPLSEYAVLTPLTDSFEVFADNKPTAEVSMVRISLYKIGNYVERVGQVVQALLDADFTITDRKYVGIDTDTGHHNYAIDIAKEKHLGG